MLQIININVSLPNVRRTLNGSRGAAASQGCTAQVVDAVNKNSTTTGVNAWGEIAVLPATRHLAPRGASTGAR